MDVRNRFLADLLKQACLSVAICIALGGCQSFEPKPAGGLDEVSTWGAGLRPPTRTGPLWSYDERARQVERNLGVGEE